MRTVIYEARADNALAEAHQRYARVDDAMEGLEWRLCRRPTDGVPRKWGFYVYKQLGIRSLNIPSILALYNHTDDEVIIHSLSFFPA
jgi:hypothetical protein